MSRTLDRVFASLFTLVILAGCGAESPPAETAAEASGAVDAPAADAGAAFRTCVKLWRSADMSMSARAGRVMNSIRR